MNTPNGRMDKGFPLACIGTNSGRDWLRDLER